MDAALSFPYQDQQREAYSRLTEYKFSENVYETEVLILKDQDMELRESRTEYIIELTLPGLVRDDLVIETVGRHLTVYLERDREGSLARLQGNYHSLIRAFMLPSGVDKNKMATCCQNGVLKIQLRKKNPKRKPNITGEMNEGAFLRLQRAMNIFRSF